MCRAVIPHTHLKAPFVCFTNEANKKKTNSRDNGRLCLKNEFSTGCCKVQIIAFADPRHQHNCQASDEEQSRYDHRFGYIGTLLLLHTIFNIIKRLHGALSHLSQKVK